MIKLRFLNVESCVHNLRVLEHFILDQALILFFTAYNLNYFKDFTLIIALLTPYMGTGAIFRTTALIENGSI